MPTIYPGHCTCADPCICEPTTPCDTSVCGDNCFTLAHPVINPANSVGPCGQTGVIELSDLNDYSNCGGTLYLSVSGYDTTAFSEVKFVDGDIQFTTTDGAQPNKYYNIFYRARCSHDGISTGSFGKIQVGIKDHCYAVSCNSGFTCNPCSGICEENEVDVGFGETTTDVGFV